MARSRIIRPEFFSSATLRHVSRDVRYLFAGLWIEADDDGRLIDSPKRILGTVFPWDEDVSTDDVNAWLTRLVAVGAIVRYAAKGGRYIAIPKWSKWQKPQHPNPSAIPPPSDAELAAAEARADEIETSDKIAGQPAHESFSAPVENRSPHLGRDFHDRIGIGVGIGIQVVGTSGEVPAPDQAPTPPDEPDHQIRDRLTDRWMQVLSPDHRNSFQRIQTDGAIRHLLTYLAPDAIDECIGRAETHGNAPRSIRYLMASARNVAKERMPGLVIPPPVFEKAAG